jgi:hypothetical protein
MMDFPPEFDWTLYEAQHNTETRGKFQVGQRVRYIGDRLGYKGWEFDVLAVNIQDEENTEYLLDLFPYLVWENEIEAL